MIEATPIPYPDLVLHSNNSSSKVGKHFLLIFICGTQVLENLDGGGGGVGEGGGGGCIPHIFMCQEWILN